MLAIAGGALALYVGLGAALTAGQRSLLYVPDTRRIAPASVMLPLEEATLATADGERLVVWRAAAAPGRPTLLYLHGNGGNLAYRAERFRTLTAQGFGLYAVSYRGYGGSTGAPSQDAILADALAAHDALVAEGVAPADIVVFGESLGTAVAVHVAARRAVGAVVLQSPFTSIADVAARHYPIYPVRLLLRDPFPAVDWVGEVRAPLLVVHGRGDRVVPFAYGERLYAAAPGPKRFLAIDAGGHNDLDRHGLLAAVAAFLADPPR